MQDFRFNESVNQTFLKTLSGLVRAMSTVLFVPAHESRIIHPKVAIQLRNFKQSTQPAINTVSTDLIALLGSRQVKNSFKPLSLKEQLGLFGMLMQFSMYMPKLVPYGKTPYEHVAKLYSAMTTSKQRPLNLTDALEISLDQSDNDIIEALWRLFVTSRQYARWYDAEIITRIPKFDQTLIEENMLLWARSITALKTFNPDSPQDIAGDNYYVWTHVLGKVFYNGMSKNIWPITPLLALALKYGTLLNHKIAHKISPQAVPNDHTIAAQYGNAIGNEIVKYLRVSIKNSN